MSNTVFSDNPELAELGRIERKRRLDRSNHKRKFDPSIIFNIDDEHPWSLEVRDAERVLGVHIRNQY